MTQRGLLHASVGLLHSVIFCSFVFDLPVGSTRLKKCGRSQPLPLFIGTSTGYILAFVPPLCPSASFTLSCSSFSVYFDYLFHCRLFLYLDLLGAIHDPCAKPETVTPSTFCFRGRKHDRSRGGGGP